METQVERSEHRENLKAEIVNTINQYYQKGADDAAGDIPNMTLEQMDSLAAAFDAESEVMYEDVFPSVDTDWFTDSLQELRNDDSRMHIPEYEEAYIAGYAAAVVDYRNSL